MTPPELPESMRGVELLDDLIIEEDDFGDHQDSVSEEEALDLESELLFPLFPEGADAGLEEEWKQIFSGDASLRTLAPLTTAAYGAAGGTYRGSGRDLGIAARLRAYGLKVVEIAGWQTRGSATFHPRGSVDHHTAGPLFGNAPSLNICTYGRSDLPGPLCQVLIGRDNTCYVIASGRANHAGTGSYAGVTGNSNVYGVEHENTGTGSESWREDQRVTASKVHAALLDWKRSGFVCQHKEWTTRKIDKWNQSGPDMRLRTKKAWELYDQGGITDMPAFPDNATRENFVKDAYRKIAGREPESVDAVNFWCWVIGASEHNAFLLINELSAETRTKEAAQIKAANESAGAALSRLSAVEEVIEQFQGGGGSGATVDQVIDELVGRIQS